MKKGKKQLILVIFGAFAIIYASRILINNYTENNNYISFTSTFSTENGIFMDVYSYEIEHKVYKRFIHFHIILNIH